MKDLYDIFLRHPDICTDTRNIKKGALFFALRGPNFNANKFAGSAIENGCAYAVIDDKEYKLDDRYILVENVLKTLQDLATYHRNQLKIPVLAITGSNGKTTTKELLKKVLEQKYRVSATIGNLNNHIGVPLTLLSINSNMEFAIIEMGANHQKEISFLCSIAKPDYGLITNIGKAHLEGFGGMEGVIKGKSELYDHLKQNDKMAFINIDNEILMSRAKGLNKYTYGTDPQADVCGTLLDTNPFLKIELKHEKVEINTRLIGKYNFENVLGAIAVGKYFHVEVDKIVKAIESYVPDNNRSQIINTKHNLLVMDAYNANPTSVMAAITNFSDFDGDNKVLILGDMLELGPDAAKEHKLIVDHVTEGDFQKIILVGKLFQSTIEDNDRFLGFKNSADLLSWLQDNPIEGAKILIKGSRGVKLEIIKEAL